MFIFELLVRIFAVTPGRFHQSVANNFDAVVVVACGVGLLVDLGGSFAALRALRLILLLRNIKLFKPLKAIIGALTYNVRFVANVLLLFIIFYTIFSQFAIENLFFSLSRRCVATDSNLVSQGPHRYCSGPKDKSYNCPASTQHCDVNFGNPHFGNANFDNTGGALLVLFQISTVSSWFEYVYALQDAEYSFLLAFPIVVYILMAMVSASLFVAVVTHGFSEYRHMTITLDCCS